MKAKGRRVALIFLGVVCVGLVALAVVKWRGALGKQVRLNQALISAVKNCDLKTSATLLKLGASPNASEGVWDNDTGQPGSDDTALLLAIDSPPQMGSPSDHTRLVQMLLIAGADPNATNDDQETPLMRAAQQDQMPEITRFLLERHANIYATAGPRTALDCASESLAVAAPGEQTVRSREIVRMLKNAASSSLGGL